MAIITIELQNYKLLDANLAIVKKFIDAHPDCTYEEIAAAIGTSVRTLYRWANVYDVILPRSERQQKKKKKKSGKTL